jgi:PAS domain S-box-containing protein
MRKLINRVSELLSGYFNKLGLGMRTKLIAIFLIVKVIPLILLTIIAWRQIVILGDVLRDIAVEDSSVSLNNSATENIERMTTDVAAKTAEFLYGRDDDILYIAGIEPSEENYRQFAETKLGRLIKSGEWTLAPDGMSWIPVDIPSPAAAGGKSSNNENNDMDGFHYRIPETFEYESVPLYDEITFIDLEGNEQVKFVSPNSTKVNYPLNPEKRNVLDRENTYVKAETYFSALQNLKPGEIYVSDVIGAYVGSNYIGMYTPEVVGEAAAARGYDIEYSPEAQAYAGEENPSGERFEGIVRWATPVTDDNGAVIGYVTFALNHDHIMEFVDHITPMNERYTELPSAFEGNYAFIWDYKCRSICHPRHHSIVGFDPETGEPQVPWLESSIYEAWQSSGVPEWTDFVKDLPTFDEQSRSKTPAPALTRSGLVGLDGRYLNNAPQCTGWMDLTRDGGSGSFYILWSGLYKLTTAAAIPYYTGQYAPSEDNDFSRRGFGIVTIGAGLEDFTRPATETKEKLDGAIADHLGGTFRQLMGTSVIIIVLVVLIAIWLASSLTGRITKLIDGISRFRTGERQFRFNTPLKDEFGTLADSFDDMADSIEDSVKNPLSIINMDHKIIYMNDYGLEFRKTTLDEIVGTSYAQNSVYPAGSGYDPIIALEGGRESEIYYAESVNRYIKGSANYFLSKEGGKLGYIIETSDVTDIVLRQNQIEEQRLLLDKVFSEAPDLIWYENAEGEYLKVNPRFSDVAGKSPEEFVGKTACEMLPRDIADKFTHNAREAISSSVPLYAEEQVIFANGHSETLDTVRTPVYDTNGALVGLLGFARNVSVRVTMENELRKTQTELEKAVNDANRANEHKGDFLARMSHEIRTPMNAIIGITNIVQKKLSGMDAADGQIDEVKANVNQIEASSQHLLGLLNDILDISKIEAGKIELSEETVELAKLANTVAGIIKPRCDEKNMTFITHFDTFSPSAFITDSLRLRQVLINLLGNAVKFTPECGTIEFSIEKKDRRDGKTLAHFSVRDNGIGIPEEAFDSIFQPFEQSDGSVTRKYGGTGLGLAISKSIVQLFGGDISIVSKVGEGSEFSFSIWLAETESDLPDEAAISDAEGKFSGKRMLLVDDVEINRIIVVSMLEGTGISIDEAGDGRVAVETFEKSPKGTYDIILMDVTMPNMDGYEASSIIRALDRSDAGTVPIVALTANAFKEDIDKALKFGMNAHIAKPVEISTLLEVLFRYLR